MTTPCNIIVACSMFSVLLLAPKAAVPNTSCNQTLSVGANIAAAVSSAANGSTICLNNGDYGSVTFSNITRSGFVTLRSVSGIGAQMSPTVSNSDYIRFTSMELRGMHVNNCSLRIEVVDSKFRELSSGLAFDGSTCTAGVQQHYLVDNTTFHRVEKKTWDGRLNFRDVDGAQVRRSTVSGSNGVMSDGIQIQGGTKNLTIGPDNIFHSIRQNECALVYTNAHCDAIQHAGWESAGPILITGNHFYNNSTNVLMTDGSNLVTIEDNVIDGRQSNVHAGFVFRSAHNLTIQHNTIIDLAVKIASKSTGNASTNGLVQNNIIHDSGQGRSLVMNTTENQGCTGCVIRYNLFTDAADVTGSGATVGTPKYAGGNLPSIWSGWVLTAGSLGKAVADDGADIGTNHYGPGFALLPAAPTSVRIMH